MQHRVLQHIAKTYANYCERKRHNAFEPPEKIVICRRERPRISVSFGPRREFRFGLLGEEPKEDAMKKEAGHRPEIKLVEKSQVAEERQKAPAVEAWELFAKEMGMLPGNFAKNIRQYKWLFAGALIVYGALNYALQKVKLPVLADFDAFQTHLKITANAITLGFATKFISDLYGQTALYAKKLNWPKMLLRAAATGALVGGAYSGLVSDNAVRVVNQLVPQAKSVWLNMAATLAAMQLVVMPPFYHVMLKTRDLIEGRIKLVNNGEGAKRNYSISWWKSYFLGTPVITLFTLVSPFVDEAVKFSALMFVSFAIFLVRTIATEQRWDAKSYQQDGQKKN